MKKKKWIALIVTGILAMALSGCGKQDEDNEVHIGYFNNVTHAQALYMKTENCLQDVLPDEIQVKWTAFNAGPAEVEALFAGDIDIGYIGPVPAITANVKSKGDVQILAGATKGGAVLITGKDSGIKSVAQLAGKNVSIPQIGNTQHLSLLHLLEENGLKPVTEGGDVTISAVANADVENVIGRGDVDAALVPEPWGATLLSKGAELVLDYDEIYMEGNYDVAVVVVRKEFYEKHPEIVEAFLETHQKVTQLILEDTEKALVSINRELKEATGKALGEDVIAEAFTRIKVDDAYNRQSIEEFAKISKAQGFISEVPQSGLFVRENEQ